MYYFRNKMLLKQLLWVSYEQDIPKFPELKKPSLDNTLVTSSGAELREHIKIMSDPDRKSNQGKIAKSKENATIVKSKLTTYFHKSVLP